MDKNIYLYGIFGEHITLSNLVEQLQGVTDQELVIHLRSEGGDLNEAFAIYDYLNMIQNPKTVIGEGIVASAATIPFRAGDKGKRLLTPNTEVMIHMPKFGTEGFKDSKQLDSMSAQLKKVESRVADFYNNTFDTSKEEIVSYMTDETYFSADKAIELGYADGLATELKAVAWVHPSKNFQTKNDTKMADQKSWKNKLLELINGDNEEEETVAAPGEQTPGIKPPGESQTVTVKTVHNEDDKKVIAQEEAPVMQDEAMQQIAAGIMELREMMAGLIEALGGAQETEAVPGEEEMKKEEDEKVTAEEKDALILEKVEEMITEMKGDVKGGGRVPKTPDKKAAGAPTYKKTVLRERMEKINGQTNPRLLMKNS